MPDRLTPQDLAARVTVFDVDDLTLWDANPNKADEDSIHASMEEWGQTATILVVTDGNGRRVVVDGNHRVAAERKARRFGGKLAGIDVTGLDWTDVRAFAAGLALNRTARLGADDEGLLAAILTQIGAEDATLLRAMAYTDDDLASLLEADGLDGGDNRIAGDPDDIPDTAPALTASGDTWILGRHRVMCGNATSPDNVEHLLAGTEIAMIFTDPPYSSGGFQEAGRSAGSIGVRAQTLDRNGKVPTITNDKLSTRGYMTLMKTVFDACQAPILYCFTDWRMWVNLCDVAEAARFALRSMIVWDKGSPGMGQGWRPQHELILFAARATVKFDIHKGIGSVIQSQRTGNPLHPTQKPVDLLEKVIAVTDMAKTIYDPFGGSGSTLIAAHQQGRTAFVMELDAVFVDRICARWERATGIVPVLEATGKPVSFLTPADTPAEAPGRKRRAPTG